MQLDYIVAALDHLDRIGGKVGVLPQVAVGEFRNNGVLASIQTATNLRIYLSTHAIATQAAIAGDTIAPGPADVTVLNSPAAPGTDRNEASVVSGSSSATGRSYAPVTPAPRLRAPSSSGCPVVSRFLTVGHHGRRTATEAPFVAAVDPTVAEIEAGRFNSYGHQSRAVVQRLQDSGARVYSTASIGGPAGSRPRGRAPSQALGLRVPADPGLPRDRGSHVVAVVAGGDRAAVLLSFQATGRGRQPTATADAATSCRQTRAS